MMPFAFFNSFFWELLSILSISVLGTFWIIEKISTQKYPMSKLILFLLGLSVTIIVWARLESTSTTYQVDGIVDLILLIAMLCVFFNFIILILRACAIRFPREIEKWLFILIVIVVLIYGVYLYFTGTLADFSRLDAITTELIHPFWIIVVLTILAQIKWEK